MRLPAERALFVKHRQLHFRGGELNLDLREQIGQLGFIAALSGFRDPGICLCKVAPAIRRVAVCPGYF